VPYTGWAMVHRGERIVPASENKPDKQQPIVKQTTFANYGTIVYPDTTSNFAQQLETVLR
jgi:hypothetical protein